MITPSLAVTPSRTATPLSVDRSYSLNDGLEHMVNQLGTEVHIGVQVQDLNDGKILYSKNAERNFTPASNLKIFTAIASLLYLGADYQFPTQLFLEPNKLANGTLLGDVIIKFSGDPKLNRSDLEVLVAALKTAGINTIQGNVYVDDSDYNGNSLGAGWMWEDANLCFSAPTSAVIINHNCLNWRIEPGVQPNQLVKITHNPSTHFLSIHNEALTTAKNTANCYLTLSSAINNQYILQGCLPQGTPAITMAIAIRDPGQYAQALIADLIASQGIHVMGQIKHNPPTEPNDPAWLTHNSPPLSVLIHTMLKKSDNIIADTLIKKLGQVYYHQPGNWENGAAAIKAIFEEKVGVNLSNAKIVDGAGLSRYDLVSPAQLVRVLNFAYHNETISKDFIDSLPIGGKDGTLKHRMSSPLILGKVQAKTGTMANVTSLSGYLKTANNHTLVFSIMINGIPHSLFKYLKLEENICMYLAASPINKQPSQKANKTKDIS